MENIESIFKKIEIMKLLGWKHRYADIKTEKGAYVPDGEEFFKEFPRGEIMSITINSILSGESYGEENNSFHLESYSKKVLAVVGWRADCFRINKKTGELVGDYGGLKIYGVESYVHILDYAYKLMQKSDYIL